MLAEWTGLEPATPGVTGRYSNQLNYHSIRCDVLPNGSPFESGVPSDPLQITVDGMLRTMAGILALLRGWAQSLRHLSTTKTKLNCLFMMGQEGF